MRILYLNTTYTGGGAEKVTRQIYEGMKNRGHEVYEIVCYNMNGLVKDSHVHVLYSNVPEKLLHRLQTYNRGNHNLTIPYAIWYIKRFVRTHKIDIIHLNNPHDSFLGIRDIAKLQELCPVVWTLHDFWALTGHCAFPFGCDNQWETGCENCKCLGNYPRLRKDFSSQLYKKKKKYFKDSKICFTVPSDWMKEQFEKSYLKEEECKVIYNSLDADHWKVLDKEQLRAAYGLKTKKMVIAFVAADFGIPQKGMHLLKDLLPRLDKERYMLLVAGKCTDELRRHIGEVEVRAFGYIENQKKMNEFYSMADILLNLSLYETFGLVNIEAMASGTPVLAFDTGVLPEVIGQEGGWCVPTGNIQSIKNTLEKLVDNFDLLREKRIQCSKYVHEKYDEKIILDQYEKLYWSLQQK